jgi:hypothetical protein
MSATTPKAEATRVAPISRIQKYYFPPGTGANEPSSTRGPVSVVEMIDPWKKAAQCEFARSFCDDRLHKTLFANLRDLWVAIADEKAVGTPDWQIEAETLDVLHLELFGTLH